MAAASASRIFCDLQVLGVNDLRREDERTRQHHTRTGLNKIHHYLSTTYLTQTYCRRTGYEKEWETGASRTIAQYGFLSRDTEVLIDLVLQNLEGWSSESDTRTPNFPNGIFPFLL